VDAYPIGVVPVRRGHLGEGAGVPPCLRFIGTRNYSPYGRVSAGAIGSGATYGSGRPARLARTYQPHADELCRYGAERWFAGVLILIATRGPRSPRSIRTRATDSAPRRFAKVATPTLQPAQCRCQLVPGRTPGGASWIRPGRSSAGNGLDAQADVGVAVNDRTVPSVGSCRGYAACRGELGQRLRTRMHRDVRNNTPTRARSNPTWYVTKLQRDSHDFAEPLTVLVQLRQASSVSWTPSSCSRATAHGSLIPTGCGSVAS